MNYVKTVFLLVLMTGILMWIGRIIGGANGVIIAFLFAMLINGVSYWYSDKIVLKMYKAKELPREKYADLYHTVESLSKNAKIPCPKIWSADINAPNAFATGRDPEHGALCLTKGVMRLLDEEELAGVISHELAHIANRDTLVMCITAALASTIMMLANMARWTAFFGGYSRGRKNSGNLIGVLALSILAPVAALLVQMAISRSREYSADAGGAIIAGNSQGLASALKKLSNFSKQYKFNAAPATSHLFIVRPISVGFVANLFSTHPPVEERVRRLSRGND
ncbi:MAG: zinc metalloprotease HtpX [Candidatus Omnitrophota bacterium]